MTNAQKYINLITDMYNLNTKAVELLQNNHDLLEAELSHYLWDDIKLAIQNFFTYKNDKSYPKLCHIIAILDVKDKRFNNDDIPDIKKPQTNIPDLQDTFNTVCLKLHIDGCYYCEYFDKIMHVPFGNKWIYNNNKLVNKLWAWQNAISTLKRKFPNVYNNFTDVTQTELYALAWKYGCVDLT